MRRTPPVLASLCLMLLDGTALAQEQTIIHTGTLVAVPGEQARTRQSDRLKRELGRKEAVWGPGYEEVASRRMVKERDHDGDRWILMIKILR